jgi:hypothetical protein
MLRRVASATFSLGLILVAACGHQVTPSPNLLTNNDLAGHIQVKFQVNGPLDFTNVTYLIAIDMCGTGIPYPQAYLTGFNSFTYAFLVGGGFGSTALPILFQYYVNPNSSGNLTKVQVNNLNPSTTEFIPNLNGQSNEFEFAFLRSDLNNPLGIPRPCPNSTLVSPTPTGAATPTPTVTPGASPTAIASGPTPTPSPAPTPTPTPFNPYLTTWTFNLMTFAANGGPPLDSQGFGGPTDATFQGMVIDTTQTTTTNSFRGTPQAIPQNPSAYIVYGEIDNFS